MEEPKPMVITSFPHPRPPPPLPSPTPLVSTPAPAPAATVTPATSANNSLECIMYKSLLFKHIRRQSLPMPIYETVNEGSTHSPRFRATVLVGDERFTNPNVFLRRKEAEHDVARIALESFHKRIKEEALLLIHEGTILCKFILNEYADKRQLDRPVYNTTVQRPHGFFSMSSLVFNGVTYTGENARTKKDAEQLAARAAILALIDDSSSSTIISEIVKSKSKFFAALPKNKDCHIAENNTVPEGNNKVPTTAISKAPPEMHPPLHAFAVPEREAVQEVSMGNNNVPMMAVSEAAPEMHPPHQAFPIPAGAAVQEGIKPPIQIVPPTVGQSSDPLHHAFVVQTGAQQEGIKLPNAFVAPIVEQSSDAAPCSGKRKKKDRRKPRKKMRTES